MCLLVFAWQSHPRYPLVLAGNRDEFHARPAAAAAWWPSPAGVLAGRDLQAGGTWLGIHRDGRFAVVTNYREAAADTTGRRSRGELVVDYLASRHTPAHWVEALAERQQDYGGYNLLVGDRRDAHYLTNRGDDIIGLRPGVYGLSNHRLDTPWPKVQKARDRLRDEIDQRDLAAEPLFRILADRSPAPDDELPDTGVPPEWERLLSATFIVSPNYGTRVSSVLLVAADGRTEFEERSYGADGDLMGETHHVVAPDSGARSG